MSTCKYCGNVIHAGAAPYCNKLCKAEDFKYYFNQYLEELTGKRAEFIKATEQAARHKIILEIGTVVVLMQKLCAEHLQ